MTKPSDTLHNFCSYLPQAFIVTITQHEYKEKIYYHPMVGLVLEFSEEGEILEMIDLIVQSSYQCKYDLVEDMIERMEVMFGEEVFFIDGVMIFREDGMVVEEFNFGEMSSKED